MSVQSSKKVIKINVKITDQYPHFLILSNFMNVLCTLVFINILKNFKLLYNFQFGFRKKHSTNHAILSIVEDIH